jgi:hypothetical protein
MLHAAANANLMRGNGAGVTPFSEAALLGGHGPAPNQTRVLTANRESSQVRPADLDAFLQGFFKGL